MILAMTIEELQGAWWLYAIGAFVAVFIISGSLFFAYKAYKQSKVLEMDKENIRKAVLSSISFSILPSIGIFIGVITMSGVLGVALPWIRLSVLGALHYELMAVDYALGDVAIGAMTVENFVTIAFTMTIAIVWGSLFTLFGFKKYQKSVVDKVTGEKGRSFGPLLFQSVFIGLVSAYFGEAFSRMFIDSSFTIEDDYFRTFVPLVVFVVSFVSMMGFDYLVQKKKIKWLEYFQLSLSMIIGMTSAVLLAYFGGIY